MGLNAIFSDKLKAQIRLKERNANMPSIDDAIRILNEINEMDSEVLPALINQRVPRNQTLADHPTVQVGGRNSLNISEDAYAERPFEVGLLGILNGLFGVADNGWGYIYCHSVPEADGVTMRSIVQFSRKPKEADGI